MPDVLAPRFVGQRTLEEKVDDMIKTKRAPCSDLPCGSDGMELTGMKDDELLRLVALALDAAMKD